MNAQNTILIVDDEPDLREMLALDLSFKGFRTIEAESVAQAMQIYQQQKIDLIVSDIMMPVEYGTALLSRLWTLSLEPPPFIFMTAYTEKPREELLYLGANAIFYKPFHLENLADSIQYYLRPLEERLFLPCPAEPVDSLEIPSSSSSGVKIARGGMMVPYPPQNYALDSLVRFKVSFEAYVLSGIGRVVWKEGKRALGMEFYALDKECQRYFLDRILPPVKGKAPYIPRL